ncbi:hypothetical protein F511_00322 [Dorcoceras hygrometricum]|nr:hypothetical protein F511_00322 [Dorcoceras hygrometricum]
MNIASQSIKKRYNCRSVECESVVEEGELFIELKIPKDDGKDVVIEDTEGQMRKTSDERRVCDLCNKTFKSGKALGGHMRIHSQKGKKKSLNSKLQSVKCKKENPRAEMDRRVTDSECENNEAVGVEERPSCPVCGKVFPSLKSVFGHMRKHSDRNWRGSRPPPNDKTSSGSCLSYDENPENIDDQDEPLGGVDLTAYLRGWNSTARRGRKRLSLEMDDVHELEQLEAAVGLMMLMMDRQTQSEDTVISRPGVGGGFLIQDLGSKMLIKNKKKRKKVRLSDLQPPQNATFPVSSEENRRQALGSHMSGHNEFTSVIKKQIEETNENGMEGTICNKTRSSHEIEIDLNKPPESECHLETAN